MKKQLFLLAICISTFAFAGSFQNGASAAWLQLTQQKLDGDSRGNSKKIDSTRPSKRIKFKGGNYQAPTVDRYTTQRVRRYKI